MIYSSSYTYSYEDSAGEEVDVELKYTAMPGTPGCMYDRWGDPGSPPEAPEMEIEDLPGHLEAQRSEIEEEIWQEIADSEAEAQDRSE
ncbi:MAG: hypothetical protein KAJ42_15440 [Gemmatimonadetes bacterium]|nr:hypothetical protein [Gemmatimonadota bacterium]